MAKCRYCDGWYVSAGGSCLNSPTGGHVVDEGPNRCIYCDLHSASSSAECIRSPSGHHVLGTEVHTSPEYEATGPLLIWICILTLFGSIAFPILYFFEGVLDTSNRNITLFITFIFSAYFGFKFRYIIIKIIGYAIGLTFLVGFLYLILNYIFK